MKLKLRRDGLPIIGYVCQCGHGARFHDWKGCKFCSCMRFKRGRSAAVAELAEVKHDKRA